MADLHIIRIDDAKALVRVGVPDPERATPQEVRISVVMALADPPDYPNADRIGATPAAAQVTGGRLYVNNTHMV